MVKVEVKNGKVYTQMKSEGPYNIMEEVGNACAELLAEFQAELIKRGSSREKVDAVFQEMIGVITMQNAKRVNDKIQENKMDSPTIGFHS